MLPSNAFKEILIDENFFSTAFQNIQTERKKLYLRDNMVTFIIGDTYSGKSTLSNLLANCQLSATTDEINWYFTGEEEKSRIGRDANSTTTLPIRIEGADGTIYSDFPGFFDTRGTERELACNFYLQALVESTEKFRIMLVIDFNVLRLCSKRLIEIAKHLLGLFTDVNKLLEGLFVVITKCKPTTKIEGVQRHVTKIISENSGLDDDTLAVLKIIAEREDRLELFREPNEEGQFDGENLVTKITKKLQKVEYIEKQDINIAISLEAKALAGQVIYQLQRKIEREAENVVKKVEEICRNKAKLETFEDFEQFLTQGKAHIELQFENPDNTNTYAKLKGYVQLIQGYKCEGVEPYDETALERAVDSLFVLNKLEIRFLEQDFSTRFLALKESLNDITKIDYGYDAEYTVLVATGIVVNIKRLTEALKGKELKRAEVYCLNTVVIDNFNVICKGINIAIISPTWKLIGSSRIDISGKPVTLPPPPQRNNTNGSPGRPGNKGGNFIGIMQQLIRKGSAKMTIVANGGLGGNGGNGVPRGQVAKLMQEKNQNRPSAQMGSLSLGRGGSGGPGGEPGEVHVYCGDEEEKSNDVIVQVKNKGGPGEGGDSVLGTRERRKREAEISESCIGIGNPFRGKKRSKSSGRPTVESNLTRSRHEESKTIEDGGESGEWQMPRIKEEDEEETVLRPGLVSFDKEELESKYREYYLRMKGKNVSFMVEELMGE